MNKIHVCVLAGMFASTAFAQAPAAPIATPAPTPAPMTKAEAKPAARAAAKSHANKPKHGAGTKAREMKKAG